MSERKKWDEETKKKIVAEKLNGIPIKEIKEKYGIKADSQIYDWVAQAKGTKKKKKVKASTKVKRKKSPNRMASAIVLLNHARDAALKEVKANPDRFDDPVYGLAMMALRTLEGQSDA